MKAVQDPDGHPFRPASDLTPPGGPKPSANCKFEDLSSVGSPQTRVSDGRYRIRGEGDWIW